MNSKRFCSVLVWSFLAFPLTFRTPAAEFIVDPAESRIAVAVRATGDHFSAELTRFEAKVQLVESNGVPASALVEWDFADLKTGKNKRDKEMLHWLEYGRSPKGSFALSECDRMDGELYVTGKLTLHETVREISFPLTVRRNGERLTFEGSVQVDHRNFGLPKIVKLLVLSVDPLLTIDFKFAGRVAPHGTAERE